MEAGQVDHGLGHQGSQLRHEIQWRQADIRGAVSFPPIQKRWASDYGRSAAGHALQQEQFVLASSLLAEPIAAADSSGDLFADALPPAGALALQLAQDYPLTQDEYVELCDLLAKGEISVGAKWLQSALSTRCPYYLLGWRDICRSTDERTVIASVIPFCGVGHTFPLVVSELSAPSLLALLGNFNSLVYDYIARQKIGGTHVTYSYIKQFPTLRPNRYSQSDLEFISSRVIELSYTATDLRRFAAEFGLEKVPFRFDPIRRHQLRSELDAYYAKIYGLTRDELRYILDPADVMGEDYPSETFRVLKKNEMAEFKEYRTRRLVLEAWDKLEQGALQ